MSPDALVLRDIHQPVSPPWWPPAPGWWAVFALIVLVVAVATWFAARRRKRQREIVALFDQALMMSPSPAAQVAAMSELLRRAARRRNAHADLLQGDDWLRFLDGDATRTPFSQGDGRVLLEGGFQRDLDSAQADALKPLARSRYLQLMAAN
ncbi:MAG: DUF4381 domain-containing protein [Lysobacter sp.]|nr:DUF4381 domain-containing protein [Lysobacter sp.]